MFKFLGFWYPKKAIAALKDLPLVSIYKDRIEIYGPINFKRKTIMAIAPWLLSPIATVCTILQGIGGTTVIKALCQQNIQQEASQIVEDVNPQK